MNDVRIVVACPDRPGVLAAIAARLDELGGDLGDTSFAVLGAAAEFTAISRLPAEIDAAAIQGELAALPELAGASVSVAAATMGVQRAEIGQVTHVVELEGIDRPGLVARLAEAFAEFGANIVRMVSERLSADGRYRIRFEVWLPTERAETCLAAVGNTAQTLGLEWHSRER